VSLPDRGGRIIYSRFYFFQQHREKTPRNVAAFVWSTAGLSAWLLGVGVAKKAGVTPMIKGIAKGYKRCLDAMVDAA
jgi:hypothetical protein